MSTQPQTVILITGANRGLGRAMVAILLQRPNHTVIATVRNPVDSTSTSLTTLARADTTNLHIIKLCNPANFIALSGTLSDLGVTYINAVIANAGNSSGFRDILNTTPEDIISDHESNVVNVVRLFKSTWPLLSCALNKGDKKFVIMTSSVGSITCLEEESFPATSYGMSKAAVNWFGKKIHVEFEDLGLVSCVLHPGWVKTSMGTRLAVSVGAGEDAPPLTAEKSAEHCIETVDKLNGSMSGKFLRADRFGEELPW